LIATSASAHSAPWKLERRGIDNIIGETGGNPSCRGPATGYTAYPPHVLDSTLQPGYTEKEFDGCIP
jgi:hypothetical protein